LQVHLYSGLPQMWVGCCTHIYTRPLELIKPLGCQLVSGILMELHLYNGLSEGWVDCYVNIYTHYPELMKSLGCHYYS
jgi:hypothetical protein